MINILGLDGSHRWTDLKTGDGLFLMLSSIRSYRIIDPSSPASSADRRFSRLDK